MQIEVRECFLSFGAKPFVFHLGDPFIDGRIILRWIFGKLHV
jgi:hypothetical protein